MSKFKLSLDNRGVSTFERVKKPWCEIFSDKALSNLFKRGGDILDIGGGLRIDNKRGDRLDKSQASKYSRFLSHPNVNYKTSDYTDKYKPDYVEDIHELTFSDNSKDAVICLSVLEHVHNPIKAVSEIHRVLKKGGIAYVYVPFLFRYHAHSSDYVDYYRFSKDAIQYLFRDFETTIACPVRGLLETIVKMTPLSGWRLARLFARFLDEAIPKLRRTTEKQTSGYYIRAVK